MMLTIHGLPVMVKYHDLKTLIKQECKMTDFILDNLVGDLDGYKKVRIGVADEAEGSHLTKCLNGYRMGGNVLRVVPLAKGPTNQPQNNFDQRGGFMPRNDMPNQPGNFGNQTMPLLGNRSSPWGPGATNQNNQWGANLPQQNQIPQNNFAFQQHGPNNPPFSQQGPAQRPSNKPFPQSVPFNQNQPAPDKAFSFGSAPNASTHTQGPRRSDRSHVLRSVELVPDSQRGHQMNRFQQENYDQNKPVTINKDYFQGASQFSDPQPNYPQGPGPSSSWNKQPMPQQKPPQFEKAAPFDEKRPIGHDKGRFSPTRGPHERRPSPGRVRRMSPGRRISPGRRQSPGDRRLPSRKSPGRRESPPKRMSPNRRLVSPGRRFSPPRRNPDKGYPDGGSQSKQIRPAYEPDGKAPNQAMYSGGYRPSAHDVQYPGAGGRQMDQREPPWQQDRDKNTYLSQIKKPDDDRRDARMPISSRGTEPLEPNRPSPMHKSRSPNRRDVRERSPLRDRYKRHSPSPRSPRRSWALEKRRSPDINQAPPPPMWPGQSQDEQYGRDKGDSGKHVPVWDHRTLAETEEAMRRENRSYGDERLRRDTGPRDLPNRREPSPRRHGFKPHEERFSPKNSRDSKFEPRDPKFELRDPKFEQRDPKFEQRDPKFDQRDPKFEPRDPKLDLRDPKYGSRDHKFEPRGPKFEPRDPKFDIRETKYDPRDSKFEPRDPKFEPRDPKFEPRDPKIDPRNPKFDQDPKFETRDPKFEPRGPKFEPRDSKFEPRGHKFEPREHQFGPRDQFKMGQPNQVNFETRGPRFEHDMKVESHGVNFEPREPKFGTRGPNFEERDSKYEPRGANFDSRDLKFEPRVSLDQDGYKYDHRSPKFESRDPKFQPRDPKFEPRDLNYEPRDPKFEPRNPKFESRDTKLGPRDPKFERESKFKPTFEPVDLEFEEPNSKFEPRNPKYASRNKFDVRDRKFEPRGDCKDQRDYHLDDDPLDRKNALERDNFREYQRSSDRHYRDEFPSRREEFPRRDDRKEFRPPHDEFQKEFEDIYKRTVEFKQKVQELRRSDRDRGDYLREDRRRDTERDDRRKPGDSDRHHDLRDDYRDNIDRQRDDHLKSHREDRSRSPLLGERESKKLYDDDKIEHRDTSTSKKVSLAPDVQSKRDKAVENIASKMMEKYGNFEMTTYMKFRIKEDLQVAISRILHDMFGAKDISFIEMVVKFNSKHDQRSEQKIFEEVMSCFPDNQYKSMKRSAQDSDRSEIPAKTSKLSTADDANIKKGSRIAPAPVQAKAAVSTKQTISKTVATTTKEAREVKKAPPKANTDGTYELTPVLSDALDFELQHIMTKVWQALPGYGPTEEDHYVIDTLKNVTCDDIRNVLGLNITERLLNVFNPLNVKVHFSTKPDRKYLRHFLKRYNFVAFKRIAKVTNTFAAQVKSIADYDELCNNKMIFCGAAKLTITPCYRFTQCPKTLQTIYGSMDIDEFNDSKELETSMEETRDSIERSVDHGNISNITDTKFGKDESKDAILSKEVSSKTNIDTKDANEPKSLVESKSQTIVKATNECTSEHMLEPIDKVSKPEPSTTEREKPKSTIQASESTKSSIALASQIVNNETLISKTSNNQTIPATKAAISQTTSISKPANIQATTVSKLTNEQTTPHTPANIKATTPKPTISHTTTLCPTMQNLASNPSTCQTTSSKPTTSETSKPTSQITNSKPTNSQTSAPNTTNNLLKTVSKPIASQTTPSKPVSQTTGTKPSTCSTPTLKHTNIQTPTKPTSSQTTVASKPSKPTTERTEAVQVIKPKNNAQTIIKSGCSKTTSAVTKTNTSNTVSTKKPFNKLGNKKDVIKEKKSSKSYMDKDDFEELDDHDILALMSEVIVLDECSGSDDE